MQHRPDAQQELFRFVESRAGWRTHTLERAWTAGRRPLHPAARQESSSRPARAGRWCRRISHGVPRSAATRRCAWSRPAASHAPRSGPAHDRTGRGRPPGIVASSSARVSSGFSSSQLLVFESLELVNGAHLVPDGEVGVPQRVQQRAQEALLLGADARAKHDQQVDVRVQAQRATAVAANRAEDNRRCSACGWRVRHRRRFGPCGPRTCDGRRGRRLLRRFRPRTRDGLHRADARRLRLGCHVHEEECLGDPWFCRAWAGSTAAAVERCARRGLPDRV